MGDHTDRPSTGHLTKEMEYITMWEMSLDLGVQPATLSRWVKQWKLDLGTQPPINKSRGKGSGYNLPTTYTLVGRGWKMTTDRQVREVMLRLLPQDPKPFLVIVEDQVAVRGTTHYDAEQASQEVAKSLTSGGFGIGSSISVFHVGEPPTKR